MHAVGGQQGLIMGGWGDVIVKRQVRRRQNVNHTGAIAHFAEVNATQDPMGDLGQTKGQMQRARRRRNIIDIACLTGHMQAGGVMGQGAGEAAHGATSNTLTAAPWSSSK